MLKYYFDLKTKTFSVRRLPDLLDCFHIDYIPDKAWEWLTGSTGS